ncbi:MAG TPA: PTS sugar transporter subunit IIA [Gemmatimonadales bacterium]|jgi:PTS system nitrogen regulatory IIA component|nr:PTS sugar transporter subunit IIA [Gemmatimonadales bacterium]
MQLSIRDAAAYLDVDEATLRRWVRTRGVPVHRANERLYLNAIELWEWATENGVPVSRRLLQQARRQPDEVAPLSTLLGSGGIHYDVGGETKSAVLREIVALLPLPADTDREFLVAVLEAREAMGSTGIGDGIAIPHVRNPILLHVPTPFVTLCLLHHPVNFDAVDRKPVHALFSVISSTVPAHLRILAQLAVVLRDRELRQLLSARAAADTILTRVRSLEARVSGPHTVPSDDE